MISYLYTITNRNGDSIVINDHATDPDNFIALQDYPVFDVDIKNEEKEMEGQHGVWDFFSFYGKRAVVFSGVIVGQTEADCETLKLLVSKVFALPSQPTSTDDGYVTIAWTDANGNSWQIEAKVERALKFERPMKRQLYLKFIVTLKAKDPTIYSQTEIDNEGLRAYPFGGIELPFEIPFLLGSSYKNLITINNAGNYDAYPQIRIEADNGVLTNPRIVNLTTGVVFQLNKTLTGTIGKGSILGNGVSGYAELPDLSARITKNQGTIACWFKSNSNALQNIVGLSNDKPLIYIDNNNLYVNWSGATGFSDGDTTTATAVAVDTWHRVVFTWINGTYYLYVDGALIETASGCVFTDTTAGVEEIGNGNFFSGLIDEIIFSDNVFTSDDIDDDYDNVKCYNIDDGLVAGYHCDEDSGLVLTDFSGNSYNGTIKGSQWSDDYKVLNRDVEYYDIDSITGVCTDQDGNDISGDIDPASQFIKLKVGVNELVYLADESLDENNPQITLIEPLARIFITYRETMI